MRDTPEMFEFAMEMLANQEPIDAAYEQEMKQLTPVDLAKDGKRQVQERTIKMSLRVCHQEAGILLFRHPRQVGGYQALNALVEHNLS
jgi:hypothetical protein